MPRYPVAVGASLVLPIALSACGGGGQNVASAPPPVVVAPTPTPSPTPTPPPGPPPPPAGPVGLVSNEPFAVLGVSSTYERTDATTWKVNEPERADISFSYRASDDLYVITLPGYRTGTLVPRYYSGSFIDSSKWLAIYGTGNDLLDGETERQDANVFLSWPAGSLNPDEKLSYTSWGRWGDDHQFNGTANSGNLGYFAYGVPTVAADMPKSGLATYNARVIGSTDTTYPSDPFYTDYIDGTAQLRFDFSAGTLQGEMKPSICPWDCYPLGVYSFIQTVYATGSTSFSGQFSINGEAVPSWFEGSFNGPNAVELMARWRAPFQAPAESSSGVSANGTMSGIWLGSKE